MKQHYIWVLIVIICMNFFLPRLMPGDPFLYLSVEDGNVSSTFSAGQIEYYKAYYGLDKPLHIQFFSYLKNLLKADLGTSLYYNTRVVEMVFTRLPWTLLIVLTSLSVSALIGTILGMVSSWLRHTTFDRILYTSMVIISEIPPFLQGLLLLFIFAARLKLFPLSGGMTVFADHSSVWAQMGDIIHHMALPVATLVLARMGGFYLMARSSMLTVLSKDYIQTAVGKGLTKRRIIWRHALRNALPPIIVQFFMSMGHLFGGAVLIENVFDYPGVGQLMREAVLNRDYTLVQGIFLMIVLLVLTMNGIAELLNRKLDPRVRSE